MVHFSGILTAQSTNILSTFFLKFGKSPSNTLTNPSRLLSKVLVVYLEIKKKTQINNNITF